MTDLLIVVDMQRDFVSGALGSEQARAIVPAVCARIRLVGCKAHTGDFAPEQVTIITAPANAWRFASYSLTWVDGETDGGLYLQLQPRGIVINVR